MEISYYIVHVHVGVAFNFAFSCFLFSIDGGNCKQALHNLWIYLLSIMANSVFKWNLVITRLGKPSSVEIRGTILLCTYLTLYIIMHNYTCICAYLHCTCIIY